MTDFIYKTLWDEDISEDVAIPEKNDLYCMSGSVVEDREPCPIVILSPKKMVLE